MKKSLWIIPFFFLLIACKSEYEAIRTSNDPERIYTKALEYYDNEEYYKAQSLIEIALPYYRGKEVAEEMYYKYAYTFYKNGEYIIASHQFKNFANTFYNSPKKEEMDFMSAYSLYLLSPSYKLDQTYTMKAIDAFQLYANTYPNSERIPEINRLIDEMRAKQEEKAFHQGELYYNIGQYQAAVQSFDNMLKDYPGSPRTEEARFLKLKSSYILAENSVYDKKEQRYDETIEYFEEFQKKHSDSKWIKEALDIYQNTLKELRKFGRV